MYINKLFLKEFGKFNNKEIKLDKGLNVLYGEPGAGKSTIRDFVPGILYGMNKNQGSWSPGRQFCIKKAIRWKWICRKGTGDKCRKESSYREKFQHVHGRCNDH